MFFEFFKFSLHDTIKLLSTIFNIYPKIEK